MNLAASRTGMTITFERTKGGPYEAQPNTGSTFGLAFSCADNVAP